jgi:isopentenyl diphosphate isomerase/L-lactate dehydrogenase-like FMN-dependent dehydrogenase
MASIKQTPSTLDRPYELPDPEAFSSYQREIYSGLRKPLFSTKPSEWESLARAKLPGPNFGYVYGSASSGKTNAFNVDAFDRYRLRPSMLVNATRRDLSVELFGHRCKSPILVGPVGVQGIVHQDGEEATARACKKLGVPMVLSTAATRTIEEVAKASDYGERW